MGGDLALSLEGTDNISRTKFPNDLFRKKFHFTSKYFWRPFLSFTVYFVCFCCLKYKRLTLFGRNLLFDRPKFLLKIFCQFVLCLTSNNSIAYFSKYWGTDAWTVLPPQILRGRPPSPPKSPPVYLGNRWH